MRVVCTMVAVAASTAGCDVIADLRRSFHPEEENAGQLGKAGLRVEVDPPAGISILLDGVRVASMSPYVNKRLEAGVHRVEVRAMGYHPVSMPVQLEDHGLVTIPVTLREREIDESEPQASKRAKAHREPPTKSASPP